MTASTPQGTRLAPAAKAVTASSQSFSNRVRSPPRTASAPASAAAVRAVAEKNTRARMVLLQVAQSEGLLPTEEEIDKTLSERAERTKKTLEEIKAATNVEALRRNEGIRRAADYVIEHSTIEEK